MNSDKIGFYIGFKCFVVVVATLIFVKFQDSQNIQLGSKQVATGQKQVRHQQAGHVEKGQTEKLFLLVTQQKEKKMNFVQADVEIVQKI